MSATTVFVLLFLTELVAVCFVVFRWNFLVTYTFILVNLLFISAYGGLVEPLLGTPVNFGNVWFSGVAAGVLLLLLLCRQEDLSGVEQVKKLIPLGGLTVLCGIMFTLPLNLLSVGVGRGDLSSAVLVVAEARSQIALGSYLGFVVSTLSLLLVRPKLKKLSAFFRLGLAVVGYQAVDSLLFFTIAFSQNLRKEIALSILSGFLLKVILTFGLVAGGLAVHKVQSRG